MRHYLRVLPRQCTCNSTAGPTNMRHGSRPHSPRKQHGASAGPCLSMQKVFVGPRVRPSVHVEALEVCENPQEKRTDLLGDLKVGGRGLICGIDRCPMLISYLLLRSSKVRILTKGYCKFWIALRRRKALRGSPASVEREPQDKACYCRKSLRHRQGRFC